MPCRASSSKGLGTWESAGRSISRVPGMAIYISESATGLPAGFVSMLRSVGVVHTAVVFLTVQRVIISGSSTLRILVDIRLHPFFLCCTDCSRLGYKTMYAAGTGGRCMRIPGDSLLLMQMTLPTFPEEERFEIEPLTMPGFFRVLCRVGYTERLMRNAAFLDSLNKALVEDIRYRALAAK